MTPWSREVDILPDLGNDVLTQRVRETLLRRAGAHGRALCSGTCGFSERENSSTSTGRAPGDINSTARRRPCAARHACLIGRGPCLAALGSNSYGGGHVLMDYLWPGPSRRSTCAALTSHIV